MKKQLITAFTALALLTGMNGAQAHERHGYDGYRGRNNCRDVFQTIKIGHSFQIIEYGTACQGPRHNWTLVNYNPHPRRYGNAIYVNERGRFVQAYNIDDRHHSHRDYKRSRKRR